jgi:hypothetical protein
VGVLDLTANLANRLSLLCHLDRGRHPARMSRNAAIRRALMQREVAVGVTYHARGLPRPHWLMRMPVVSLQQTIGCGRNRPGRGYPALRIIAGAVRRCCRQLPWHLPRLSAIVQPIAPKTVWALSNLGVKFRFDGLTLLATGQIASSVRAIQRTRRELFADMEAPRRVCQVPRRPRAGLLPRR